MRKYRSKEANIKSYAPAVEAKAMGGRIDHYCELFEEFYDELGLRKKNDNVSSCACSPPTTSTRSTTSVAAAGWARLRWPTSRPASTRS
jgi:hypothetical protein